MAKKFTPAITPDSSDDTPARPWPDFPLHWHKTGRWRKKYRGQHYYFEADPIKSYDAWKKLEDQLQKGEPQPVSQRTLRGFVLQDAINAFLNHQHHRYVAGKIKDGQMAKYVKEIKTELPKAVSVMTRLEDFADERRGPGLFAKIKDKAVARGLQVAERHIVLVRALFTFVSTRGEHYLMAPPHYSDKFDKPTLADIEQEKFKRQTEDPDEPWTLAEAARIIDAAAKRDPHLYAQCVLMAVGGYTAADLAALPIARIERQNGVINFPRVKNFRRRLCPLIPAVLNALDASLKVRPKPAAKEYAGLVFLNRNGTPLSVSGTKKDDRGHVIGGKRRDAVHLRIKRLCETLDELDRAKLPPAKRKEFKGLRRKNQSQKTFRTLNYRAAVGAGVHDDFIAVLRGRRFARPIEDYYLRSELREDLNKLALHIAQTFGIPETPPKTKKGLRYNGPYTVFNKPPGSSSPASGDRAGAAKPARKPRGRKASLPAPSTD